MSTQNTKCKVIKYAEDTVIVGSVLNNDETDYRQCISSVSNWCRDNYLNLNVTKTKEIIFDFRKKCNEKTDVQINDKMVETVKNYKYLGCTINARLDWQYHVSGILKKAEKKLYYLRTLKKFKVDKAILGMFYNSVIESTLIYAFPCWYYACSGKTKKELDKIRKQGVKLVGDNSLIKSHQDISNKRCLQFLEKIISDENHPLNTEFKFLPHGKRLNVSYTRTKRFSETFVPHSIKLFNSQVNSK